MDKYRCIVCGYIYDPRQGFNARDQTDTAFSDLPDAGYVRSEGVKICLKRCSGRERKIEE